MLSVGEGKSEAEAFSKWRVGVHTSIAGSLAQAAEHAHQIGCTSFQIFSSSPRMWRARDLTAEEISAFVRLRWRYDLSPVVIHTNYLVNLASPDPLLRQRSLEAFVGEIRRAEALGAEYLVLHPGSCRDGSKEQGIRTVAASLREAIRIAQPVKTTILVENMCGQGNVLGGSFAELRDILALLDGLPVECCVDTAHCFAAGMDIATAEGLAAMLSELDRTVGLRPVPVIHANDSRSPLGSHRDRHEHIGKGGIGLEGFRRIVNHPALRKKVFILETPIETEGDDRRNLQAIRSVREGETSRTRPVRARPKRMVAATTLLQAITARPRSKDSMRKARP
ncbi:MAG: deoxyribonuclease IV [Acidobacteria bacterium]|nr:deoxyribonuclease IV [Acidobacteriota bacterium]